ncbi:MAG TPA: hypothetical protein VJ835_09480 [Fimbriimonadaceae bacterium]|nr:hypothetical protein [Fimbriimonadaceae bacterium]
MTSLFVASLFLVPPFDFAGGNDNDLVAALANQYRKPVVMLASQDGGHFKKCKIPEGRDIDFMRLVRAYLKVEVAPKFNGGVSLAALPWGLVHKANAKEYAQSFKDRPAKQIEISDGKITAHTTKLESITIEDIQGLSLSKPLKAHRFFEGVHLRLSVVKASEGEFLESLATALGARLVERQYDRLLDVDEKQYRLRAIEAWKQQADRTYKTQDWVPYSDAAYMVEVLTQTDNKTIKKAFLQENKGKAVGTKFPRGSKVYNLAYERVRIFVNQAADDSIRNLFRRVVDVDQPIWGIISVEGDAKTIFYNREQNERVTF